MAAQRHRTNAATLLGSVMAHELAHLLAVGLRSPEGIMRDDYGWFHMVMIRAHLLSFTAKQAKVIRSTVIEMNAAHSSAR